MLGDNRATTLFHHIRALERLQEVKDDAAADFNERRKLAKEDGFDTNVIAAILKRRKNGEGQTQAFDDLLREYEDAIEDQRTLPLGSITSIRIVTGDEDEDEDAGEGAGALDEDGVYALARQMVTTYGKASTSWLQRRLQVGYNSAARLIERMEKEAIVSAPNDVGRRTVLITATPAVEGETVQ